MAVKTTNQADIPTPRAIGGHGAAPLVRSDAFEPRRQRARIKIGGVYVTGDKASAAQVKLAVAKSSDMLERLGDRIARPGVQLKAVRNVPLFFADPKHPGRFLRKLNGKIEGGVLENGAFKVVD